MDGEHEKIASLSLTVIDLPSLVYPSQTEESRRSQHLVVNFSSSVLQLCQV